MRQSLLLRLAVLFVRADLHREQQAWRRQHRRVLVDFPYLSEHLLQDIGIGRDRRLDVEFGSSLAQRKARHLRRAFRSRQLT
ncbi:hypothetical protein A3K86_11240 [Photobacterium jeanii]|uniref:DUF1127 domain-containing protein n=1 Tax=Photobacterium jeanii TaxID=858640 RepID=A0A178KC04_9GAMM|nr:hypothetical protein [Photobacterium jeanii]OAN14153.1 hypothetical protein A3K86_11240 [Photobacterium jeanii]PST89672.1 hypothetical protein C9I91_11850 [Photobacterium jeanii]